MNAISKSKIDESAVPAAEDTAAVRPPDLTVDMVREFLRHILKSLETDSEPWRRQLAATPRGADFDMRDHADGATVLDKLSMASDALGEALARGDAPADVGQSVFSHLAAPLKALTDRREAAKRDARQQVFLKRYAAVLNRLEDDVSSVGRSMGDLSVLAARGAASLDPDATRRILNRMRNLGDATMRLIEDRIASTKAREEGKRLRALRDDLKVWIEERNARLEQAQMAVDELNIRSDALRNECLMQAGRLAAAAVLASRAVGGLGAASSLGPIEQAAPEAMVFSAGLRALLLEAHTDVAAPLRE